MYSVGEKVRLAEFDQRRYWGTVRFVAERPTTEDEITIQWSPYHMDPNRYPAPIEVYTESEIEPADAPLPFKIHERIDYILDGLIQPNRIVLDYNTEDSIHVNDSHSIVSVYDAWPSGTQPPFDVNIRLENARVIKDINGQEYFSTQGVLQRTHQMVKYRDELDNMYTDLSRVDVTAYDKGPDDVTPDRQIATVETDIPDEFGPEGLYRFSRSQYHEYRAQRNYELNASRTEAATITDAPDPLENNPFETAFEFDPLDNSTWPGRADFVEPLLGDRPLDGTMESTEGLRLPFQDLQDLHNELTADLDIPEGEPIPFDEMANAAQGLEQMGLTAIGLAIDLGFVTWNAIVQANERAEVIQERRQSLINTFLKRGVYVFVKTPGDPTHGFKWWRGVCQDVQLEENRISYWLVEYLVNLGERHIVRIEDGSNIMIDRYYQPKGSRIYMYALDKQILGNSEVTFDKYDNYLNPEILQHYAVFDPVTGPFEETQRITRAQQRENMYWYQVTEHDEWFPETQLRPSTDAEMQNTLTKREQDNANILNALSTIPQKRPGWGIVFLRASDPFVIAHDDEVLPHPAGFSRLIFRDRTQTLYVQFVTEFPDVIHRLGDLPFPVY